MNLKERSEKSEANPSHRKTVFYCNSRRSHKSERITFPTPTCVSGFVVMAKERQRERDDKNITKREKGNQQLKSRTVYMHFPWTYKLSSYHLGSI